MKRKSRIEAGQDVSVVAPLFDLGNPDPPKSPKQFTMQIINGGRAMELNQQWHSRLPLFGGALRIAYGLEYEGRYYGVAMWSHPVARLLPQHTWLELRRMALSPECPRNTATWFLGQMVKDIRNRYSGLERLISYQDTEVHHGTIYKASNWMPVDTGTKGGWDRPNRNRPKAQSESLKVRWEYQL